MNIIIECVDRVGKDSLIANIRKHYAKHNMLQIKVDAPIGDACAYNQRILELCQNNDYLIFNRSHLGEAVYSKLYRCANNEHIQRVYDLEKSFNLSNTVLLLLTGDADVLFARDDGNSNSKSPDDINHEQCEFKDAFNKSSITRKIMISTIDKSIDDVANECINFIDTVTHCEDITH